MLATIVRGSLANPRIVTALSLLVALLGVSALLGARLDVFPDFAPPHVLVQAEAPGLDATQVESLVTRPLEDLLGGAENIEVVRSPRARDWRPSRWSSDATLIRICSGRSSANASPMPARCCRKASGRRCCRR